MKYIFFSCCLLIFSGKLVAQDYFIQYQDLGEREGLSDRNVIRIYQAKDGLIWVGTQFGINRFDGHSFQHITRNQGQAFETVDRIFEDTEGNIWFEVTSFDSALFIFEPKSQQISFAGSIYPEIRHGRSLFPQKFSNTVIVDDDKGNVYAIREGNAQFVFQLDEKENSVNIQQSVAGYYWVYSHHRQEKRNFISVFNPAGKRVARFEQDVIGRKVFTNQIDWNRFPEAKEVARTMFTLFLPAIAIDCQLCYHSFYFDPATEKLWALSADHQLKTYEWQDDELKLIAQTTIEGESRKLLKLVDRQGKLWLFGETIEIVDLQQKLFKRWENRKGFSTRQILRKGDSLFVASYGGAHVFDLNTGEKALLIEMVPKHQVATKRDYRHVYSQLRSALSLKQKEDTLWIGSNRLLSLVPNESLEIFDFNENYKARIYISSMVWMKDMLWLGTNGGLFYLDTSAKDLKKVSEIQKKVPNLIIHSLHKVSESFLWICTTTGWYSYDLNTQKLEHYHADGEGKYQLPFQSYFLFIYGC